MYLEWMQAKAIPNQKLLHFHRFCTGRTTCIMIPPPLYPARPTNKHHFQSIGGFNQHPNATKDPYEQLHPSAFAFLSFFD